MTEILPSVLFVSCFEEDPLQLIKLMLNELPVEKHEDKIISYDWHINTKYYEADIRLCITRDKCLSSPEFASSVEGVCIYFDSSSPRGLERVEEWMTFLGEYEAEIKILVCKRFPEISDSPLSKLRVQEWCVKNGFELVELNPVIDVEWENEQDFVETSGIDRIIQALHAHVWPNLILKERKDPTTLAGLWHGGFCQSTVSNYENSERQISSDDKSVNDEDFYENSRKTQDNIEPTPEELFADETTDFCDLFSQLPMMKEKANSMPSEQRKKFAEEVVLAYWKAIGGDLNEILDC